MRDGAGTSDVVVVGCGIAGLAASVSALQAGASVTILERAPAEERGGNTRWTESLLRMKSESAVSDDFEAHFMANAGHHLDPGLVNETARGYSEWPAIVKTLGFTDPELVAGFATAVSAYAATTLRLAADVNRVLCHPESHDITTLCRGASTREYRVRSAYLPSLPLWTGYCLWSDDEWQRRSHYVSTGK